MNQKWNLQDIVPPDRAKRNAERRENTEPVRQAPAREMRIPSDTPPPPPPKTIPRPMLDTMPENTHSYSEENEVYETPQTSMKKAQVTNSGSQSYRKYIFGVAALIVIGLLGFLVTYLLNGAEITVKPKMYDTTVQASFAAKLKPNEGELGYELLTLAEEGEREVTVSGSEQVKEQATGEITVFNKHSTSPQRLIKNTRFEAPGGLIYRISEAIEVPGYTTSADGTIIPGSRKATVLSDGTGEKFNIASVKLTVPGLKGSEQFDTVYAEADATGITGGFEGEKFIIDDAELTAAKNALHTELKGKLLTRIQTERPNGFIVYEPAITYAFISLPSSESAQGKALIKEKVQLIAPLFNETSFSSFIARNTLAGYEGESVRLKDASALTFGYQGEAPTSITSVDTINFNLSGPITVIWNFDSESLKNELIGMPESNLPSVLAKYEAIDKAKAVIRPIWKSSFPENPEDITITEVEEI